MCDGTAVRRFALAPLRIGVGPIVISRHLGKRIDLFLVDDNPVADADLFSEEVRDILEATHRPLWRLRRRGGVSALRLRGKFSVAAGGAKAQPPQNQLHSSEKADVEVRSSDPFTAETKLL